MSPNVQATKPKPSWLRRALPLMIVLALPAYFFARSMPFIGPRISSASSLNELYLHRDDRGVVLVAVEAVRVGRYAAYRIDTLDPKTGARLHRVVFGSRNPRVLGGRGHTLWLAYGDFELFAFDPIEGQILADSDGLRAKNPALSPQFRVRGHWSAIDARTGGAIVHGPDGRTYLIDPTTLRAQPVEAAAIAPVEAPPPRTPRSVVLRDGTTLTLTDEQGTLDLRNGPAPASLAAKRYLRAEFYAASLLGPPIVFDAPDSVLLRHCATVLPESPCSIARIAGDGREVWSLSATALNGSALMTAVYDEVLFVSAARESSMRSLFERGASLYALDPKTGTVRWATSL